MTDQQTTGRPLTKRERQSLELAAYGLTNEQIGRKLHVSERTARRHLEAARQKLRAANTVHAVAMALAGQLIKFDTNLAPGPAN